MLDKKIIKISDLKLYQWALKIDINNSDVLIEKYDTLGASTRVDFNYWAPHLNLLSNVPFFVDLILSKFKDLVVLINDEPYCLTQNRFSNSEALLLDCLNLLYHNWIGLLPVMSELYKHYIDKNVEFSKLEYEFLDIWLDILPVMDELINMLNKMNSKFIFEISLEFGRTRGHFTINFMVPRLATDDSFVDKWSPKASKEDYIEHAILDSLVYKEEYKTVLYAWLQTKLEYKFRIRDQKLPAKEAIHLLLKEHVSGLSMETIKFLCVNPVADLDEVRQAALQHEALLK